MPRRVTKAELTRKLTNERRKRRGLEGQLRVLREERQTAGGSRIIDFGKWILGKVLGW